MPSIAAEAIDEATVLRAAKCGDAEAFTFLFQRYHPMIYAYAFRLCLRQSDAEDIAQETFIKAARALPAQPPDAPFRAWLYQIATNTARDFLRRHQHRERLVDAIETRARADGAERPPDHELAKEALATLPEELRLAVVLVFFEGHTHAEAAAALGCAETTISWRIFTAKRKLKTALSRHDR